MLRMTSANISEQTHDTVTQLASAARDIRLKTHISLFGHIRLIVKIYRTTKQISLVFVFI